MIAWVSGPERANVCLPTPRLFIRRSSIASPYFPMSVTRVRKLTSAGRGKPRLFSFSLFSPDRPEASLA